MWVIKCHYIKCVKISKNKQEKKKYCFYYAEGWSVELLINIQKFN